MMIQYTKSEFCGGPKDGDRRVADRTKMHHFTCDDPGFVHAYSWFPNQNHFVYLGHVERKILPLGARVEPLTVGVER